MSPCDEGSESPFQEWVNRHPNPGWKILPFTHITRGLIAEKILSQGFVEATECKVFKEPLAYFFYGRAAYRANSDKIISLVASTPFCFIFSNDLIEAINAVYPFDTGALNARIYDHILDEGLSPEDFKLKSDLTQIAKLVSATFSDQMAYFCADRSKVKNPDEACHSWEMQAQSYLALIKSQGRNEPDDRVCTVEVTTRTSVPLNEKLLAIVVPHTVWNPDGDSMPLLEGFQAKGVVIATYPFIPGRPPEYYQGQLESSVRELYMSWGLLS